MVLILIILVFNIGLVFLILLAKKVKSIQDNADYSHSYSSTTSASNSYLEHDDWHSDECRSSDESNSDSNSCDSSNHD